MLHLPEISWFSGANAHQAHFFCYYQDWHNKPGKRSLSRRGYQILLNIWSTSWSRGYSISLLTSVIPASFAHKKCYFAVPLWKYKQELKSSFLFLIHEKWVKTFLIINDTILRNLNITLANDRSTLMNFTVIILTSADFGSSIRALMKWCQF